MRKAAIFDMDGTLLDSVDLHALARQDALIEFGAGQHYFYDRVGLLPPGELPEEHVRMNLSRIREELCQMRCQILRQRKEIRKLQLAAFRPPTPKSS